MGADGGRGWVASAEGMASVVSSVNDLEVFVCAPLGGVRLSRSACGRRHAKSRAKGEKGVPGLVTGTCARCKIGAKHAKGQVPSHWEDGTPVVTAQVQPIIGQQRLQGPGSPAPRPLRRLKRS
jgi:hypothetical protein